MSTVCGCELFSVVVRVLVRTTLNTNTFLSTEEVYIAYDIDVCCNFPFYFNSRVRRLPAYVFVCRRMFLPLPLPLMAMTRKLFVVNRRHSQFERIHFDSKQFSV